MLNKVLIANRGEIACRIIRTLDAMGVASVAVYADADYETPHVAMAGEAVSLGGPGESSVDRTYLRPEKILDAAKRTGSDAIHPGYGFLSENAGFAEACESAGCAFLGPTPRQIRDFGLKHTARELAARSGVPLLPGSGLLNHLEHATAEAARVGYPVMLKSTAGGGGIGMQVCRDRDELAAAYDRVTRLGASNFGSAGVFLEKFIDHARHVEVQVFGDGTGRVVTLGERDCSAQRRNQKVIEETPAPNLTQDTRRALADAARSLCETVAYRSAGTVEFVLDADSGAFYFLEVNTRLQVEHGVTELVTGLDLVEWMVRLGGGDGSMLDASPPEPTGHAFEVRLYAEDPALDFRPSAGLLTEASFPNADTGVRVDTWVEPGTEVTPHYDPMIAKLLVHGETRDDALRQLQHSLDDTRLSGIETNLPYLRQVARSDAVTRGEVVTRTLAGFDYRPPTFEVLSPGSFTTVQDYPGRVGYWHVGVPPCGPMDHLSFRLGNRLLGNEEGAAGLEMTVTGPTLRFDRESVIVLTGANMAATLDGEPVATCFPTRVPAGGTLKVGCVTEAGVRGYLLVRGGIDVPVYLGSRSTFTLGKFGGHGGRRLAAGDVLHLNPPPDASAGNDLIPPPLPDAHRPALTHAWTLGVAYGPHGSPDFFTADDVEMFFTTDWEVHYNSARTGVRLLGPKPKWAREDGGEAGLHPSNIHDNAYAIGAIDFTGDMPVILGPDGPSLGGFVCPAVVVQPELWKIGQLAPGDTVRFVPLSLEQANRMEREQDAALAAADQGAEIERRDAGSGNAMPPTFDLGSCELRPVILGTPPPDAAIHRTTINGGASSCDVVIRPSGDRYVLVEFGPNVLDLDLRFRAHCLKTRLQEDQLPGIIDLTPGIRSLQIHYDPRKLATGELVAELRQALDELPPIDDIEVPSRIVHLPLSWDDPAIHETIAKYSQGVRDDAPWCPSNIEFIRRINGLDSIDDVRRIVFDASYLVMGLGDVYLGAPVATPIDPRHRLVTTKYNPARTWTPPNVVGIGGAYMCIYGMEGPGGYQLFGRTLQVWNTYRQTDFFTGGKPWLLRFFDRVRFFPVSHEELTRIRRDFPLGRYEIEVEHDTFKLSEYHAFRASIEAEAKAAKARQQAAFEAERKRWEEAGEFAAAERAASDAGPVMDDGALSLADGQELVASPMGANVWKVVAKEQQSIEAGDPLLVLEAMKMETTITAPAAGRVNRILCQPGQLVTAGAPLMVLEPA
ncbi:MAG: urea carboxylase [Phycisphaeraceae bacterium]